MTRYLIIWFVLMTGGTIPTIAAAQPAGAAKPAPVPLEVQLVLSRYEGDKKISSMPYTLTVNANGNETQLNMGTEVPVPSTTFGPVGGQRGQGGAAGGGRQGGADGQAAPAPASPAPLVSYNYRPIGTSIELRAATAADGWYELQVNVQDSSVFSADARQQSMPIVPDMPAFRSFRNINSVLLRDGQSRQYTVATDRVTGEVLKIDVSLKVLK